MNTLGSSYMATAIEFENISKQYRLGLVSTKTLSHDLNRWFTINVLRKEDPYLKIGETNDRSTKGSSDYVWALKDIDFKVEQGDVVGIIGKNGAGKSTLLKILSRVTTPTTGRIRARGRIASLLEVGTGFHPELTGHENIYMNGAILGMTKHEIDKKLDEIVDFSGCERYIDTPVKRYSSGMMVRLGFAVAAHLDPEILVVDEVLAVGDAEFQKKAIGKMNDISKGEGRTVLFVSHNMASIRALCSNGLLLENGRIKYTGKINDVVDEYLSINTELQAIPLKERIDRKGNGKARIVSARILNEKGEEVPQILIMQPLTIEMTFDAKEDIDNAIVMFSIYNSTGVLITSGNSKLNTAIQMNIKKGSKTIVRCVISEMPLSIGMYSINTRLTTNDYNEIDWIENVISFEIVETDVYGTGQFIKESSSITILPQTWCIA